MMHPKVHHIYLSYISSTYLSSALVRPSSSSLIRVLLILLAGSLTATVTVLLVTESGLPGSALGILKV